ncbi:hypothetical protein GCM10018790_47160 [Kitasatospora xanthocidica]|uniref:hypothetical protein n=1 Tax=Kitasatospora xanthocidica TaxID=83382 RepID=UPI00167893E6|nr:hypothetical protein [Kitasatospora xanthocidica]GHF63809.1 hypothetical protein GCM10018790_47160 [Kitasatospora xanthocidica]
MTETVRDGFRLAAVFDVVDPVTGPGFAPDRPRLEPGEEREAVARYLRTGAAVLLTTMLMDDVVEPDRRGVVPMGFRTDGRWIWTDTVTYYLEEYGLAPDPELLAHVRAQGDGPWAEPEPAVLERAVSFVLTPPEETEEPVWTVGS